MPTLRTVTRQQAKPGAKASVGASAKATTTTTTEVKMRPELRRKLLANLRAYAELDQQAKPIKLAMDKHKAAIRELRESTGEKKLEIEGFKLTDVAGESTFFDKDEFVLRGGDLALYNDCLKKKPKKAYEKITLPGEKDDVES